MTVAMSFNIQLLTVCSISLLTGIYIGSLFNTKQQSSRQQRKGNNRSSHPRAYNSDSTPSSPNSDIITEDTTTSNDNADSSDFEESEEEDYQIDSSSLNDIPGETRMALVIRTDLGMKRGKAAAQCAHAALGCYKLMLEDDLASQNLPLLRRWEKSGQAKITLQVRSKEDLDLLFAKAISLNVNSYIVHDAGRTQVEAGSATVLGLGPAPKLVLDQITSDLKLF
jgi:PTH2 family peptidyl-tRNA hydrolase